MVYPDTMEYNAGIQRNKIQNHITMLMNLRMLMFREIGQTQTSMCVMYFFIQNLRSGNTNRKWQEEDLCLPRIWSGLGEFNRKDCEETHGVTKSVYAWCILYYKLYLDFPFKQTNQPNQVICILSAVRKGFPS